MAGKQTSRGSGTGSEGVEKREEGEKTPNEGYSR